MEHCQEMEQCEDGYRRSEVMWKVFNTEKVVGWMDDAKGSVSHCREIGVT